MVQLTISLPNKVELEPKSQPQKEIANANASESDGRGSVCERVTENTKKDSWLTRRSSKKSSQKAEVMEGLKASPAGFKNVQNQKAIS